MQGRNELIAACGFEARAIGPGPRSFTAALIQKLNDFATPLGQVFSIADLHQRILYEILHRNSPTPTPVYIRLSGQTHQPSIPLQCYGRTL